MPRTVIRIDSRGAAAELSDEFSRYDRVTQVKKIDQILVPGQRAFPVLCDHAENPIAINGRPVVCFGSGMRLPEAELSNFAATCCVLTPALLERGMRHGAFDRDHYDLLRAAVAAYDDGTGIPFPSSEHLYQSLRVAEPAAVCRFATTGVYGQWPGDVSHPFDASTSDADRAQQFAAFRRKNMIGVIAKMAIYPARAKRLGLALRHSETLGSDYMRVRNPAVWRHVVLPAKYEPVGRPRNLLAATGDAYLVEFSRSTRADCLKGRHAKHHWDGAVTLEPTDRDNVFDSLVPTLFGANAMGSHLMEIRATLGSEAK